MSPLLINLQPELQLTIVDALGPDLTGLHDNDIQAKYNDEGDYAPSRDVKLKDREKESRRNLLNWSCASKSFRALLAPFIFKTLVLRNEEKSAASVEAVAKHPEYGMCVKEVQFVGRAPCDDEPSFRDVEGILPERVAGLLSDLKRFPNLESLSVEFDFDFFDYSEWTEEGVYPGADEDEEDEVRQKEGEEAWRALMAKVWEAICLNEAGVVKKLTINNLYHKKVSTFTTPPFRTLLSHVTSFTLSIYGAENGACWQTNTCEVWSWFVSQLDIFFFEHLPSLLFLTLKASEMAPLGLDGENHAQLVLRSSHMPLLQRVHLEYLFISPELRDFLVGKMDTLEYIHLRSCLAEIDECSMVDDGLRWHELFDAITAAKPQKLTTLRISEERPAPLAKADCGMFESRVEEEEEARRAVDEGRRRVWAHVHVDDKYGMLFEDVEGNSISFQEGRDGEAWERLMDVVRANRG